MGADDRLQTSAPVLLDALSIAVQALRQYTNASPRLVDLVDVTLLADEAEYINLVILSLAQRLTQQLAQHVDIVDHHHCIQTRGA